MRPLTHALVGAAVGIVFAPNTFCFAACIIGSVAPDYLDSLFVKIRCKGKRLPKEQWRILYDRQHRTWTHNLSYWLLPFLFLFVGGYLGHFSHALSRVYNTLLLHVDTPALTIAEFFFGGILLHIACDFLTPMGVGFIPFLSRVRFSSMRGLRIRTNSLADKLFGFAVFGIAAGFCFYRGKLRFLEQIW